MDTSSRQAEEFFCEAKDSVEYNDTVEALAVSLAWWALDKPNYVDTDGSLCNFAMDWRAKLLDAVNPDDDAAERLLPTPAK